MESAGAKNQNLIPEDVSEYRSKAYWDERYQIESTCGNTYEWFKSYEYFSSVIRTNIKSSDRILMLGCGNSRFSEDMCQEGFEDIVNVDYSEPVIEMMKERTKEKYPSLQWYAMDFRNMSTLLDDSFDIILDKGSLDAVWSDGGSQWDPSEAVLKDINASLDEVIRLLKPKTGKFITITFGQPHFRLPHMERPDMWKLLSKDQLGLYYIYIFEKN